MSDYAAYFLASSSSVVHLELIEISHPAFTRTYRIVRNALAGVDVILEDATAAHFDYYPLRIRPVGAQDDLDQSIEVDLGDLGELIPQEIDAAKAAGRMVVKPTLIYRVYRSDDLAAPMLGPSRLEVTDVSSTQDGSSLAAKAPSLNQNRTGELYRVDRFPMLRGFL